VPLTGQPRNALVRRIQLSGEDEKRTPWGFNVLNRANSTVGNSWLGTWNREGVGENPVKAAHGQSRSQQILMQHLAA
jgi:hypothetical protein